MRRGPQSILFTASILLAVVSGTRAQQAHGCGTTLTRAEAALQSAADATWSDAAGNFEPGNIAFVPIAFHIVRDSEGAGGLDPSTLASAIPNLNTYWVASGIRFFGVGPLDFIDDEDLLYINGTTELNQLKHMNVVPDVINIYCVASLDVDGLSLCGISSFTTTSVQGIVMSNDCMPPWDDSTLPHEVGHYFDLYHTHETVFGKEKANGTNCQSAGDKLCDTPADPKLDLMYAYDAGTCTYTGDGVYFDPNGDDYDPLTDNIMSYAYYSCRFEFTLDQRERALDRLLTLRPELVYPPWPGLGDNTGNSISDSIDIVTGQALDDNSNGIPDTVEPTLTLRVAATGSAVSATGASWSTAYPGLKLASEVVDRLGFPVTLWLKEGTYKPTVPGGDPNVSIELGTGMKVYGGFAGTETSPAQRDTVAHPTILSGDLNGNDSSGIKSDNSYHVVTVPPWSVPAPWGDLVRLDGVTISGGYASTSATVGNGAGVYVDFASSLDLVGCIVKDNATHFSGSYVGGIPTWSGGVGGGVYGDAGTGVVLEGCTFTRNVAAQGAAVGVEDASALFVNDCTFTDNDTGTGSCLAMTNTYFALVEGCALSDSGVTSNSDFIGPPIMVLDTDLTLQDSLIAGNRSSDASALSHDHLSSVEILRCTIAENVSSNATSSALESSAVSGMSTETQLRETILWGNLNDTGGGESAQLGLYDVDADWCAVEGWSGTLGGTGTTGSAPYFQDPVDGDYRLAHGSPLINAGDPAEPLDPDGSASDVGAFTFDPTVYNPWTNLGYALAGTGGLVPQLTGAGSAEVGSQLALHLTHAYPSAITGLFTSIQSPFNPVPVPFKGGSLIANPATLVTFLPINAAGELFLPMFSSWPGVPAGTVLIFQFWTNDPGPPKGASASNGLLLDQF